MVIQIHRFLYFVVIFFLFDTSFCMEREEHPAGLQNSRKRKKTGKTKNVIKKTKQGEDTKHAKKVIVSYPPQFFETIGGINLFFDACLLGKIDQIENFLTIQGVNINVQNTSGMTPLCYLCYGIFENSKTIKYLLERGAQVNIADNKGCTPLWYACQHVEDAKNPKNWLEIVEILLEYGANPMIQDHQGKLPFSFLFPKRPTVKVRLIKRDIPLSQERKKSNLIPDFSSVNKKKFNEIGMLIYNNDIIKISKNQ